MTIKQAEKNNVLKKTNNKQWIKSIQGWSWIITILWMVVANFYKPFGVFGFVCMFTPIVIALSGRGKMHCAIICPRGSFIATFTKRISLHLPKPKVMNTMAFSKGVYVFGNAVLIFMEVATAIAFVFGVLFTPRAWCTVCPMGFTTGKITRKMDKSKT